VSDDQPRPFKIVGKLIGAIHDEAGEVVGEPVLGDVVIYRAQFGELEALVERALRPPSPS